MDSRSIVDDLIDDLADEVYKATPAYCERLAMAITTTHNYDSASTIVVVV